MSPCMAVEARMGVGRCATTQLQGLALGEPGDAGQGQESNLDLGPQAAVGPWLLVYISVATGAHHGACMATKASGGSQAGGMQVHS